MMDLDKIIKEKWTSPTNKGYVNIDGFMLPQKYQDFKSEFDNLKINEDDVWVCTFPKCGTTWIQEMVWLLANSLDYETSKQKTLDERFPFLELSAVADFTDALKNKTDFVVPQRLGDSLSVVKALKSPAFIKTHLPLQLLPKEIQNGIKKPKIIYVTRDPRDVCVSYFHHSTITEYFEVTFDEYCELFLAGKVNYGPFWSHILPFWKKRLEPNILFLKYEDMKKDLKDVIRQVAHFLERTLSEEEVNKLASHLSFDSMKHNPSVNREASIEFVKSVYNKQNDGKFIRKGIVGDYKLAMSPTIISRFDQWIKKNIQDTDYVI